MNNTEIKKINKDLFLKSPQRYELREGSSDGAPLCPYGNHYAWIGYDLITNTYVRFTKSVFKELIINKQNDQMTDQINPNS